MSGKVLSGVGAAGGEPNGVGPSISTATPVSGSIIDVSSRRLRIKLAAVQEGVGIDLSTIRIRLNGAVIFDGSTWHATYVGSYIEHHGDGTYTVVVLRGSDWLPATRYFLFIDVADNTGIEG